MEEQGGPVQGKFARGNAAHTGLAHRSHQLQLALHDTSRSTTAALPHKPSPRPAHLQLPTWVIGCSRTLRSTFSEAIIASWILPGVLVTLTCHQPGNGGAAGGGQVRRGQCGDGMTRAGPELGGTFEARAPPSHHKHGCSGSSMRTRGQAVEERQLERHVVSEAQSVAHLGQATG